MMTSPSSSTSDGIRPSGLIRRISSASANTLFVLRSNAMPKTWSEIATRRTNGLSYWPTSNMPAVYAGSVVAPRLQLLGDAHHEVDLAPVDRQRREPQHELERRLVAPAV